jgi:hypothetical protein
MPTKQKVASREQIRPAPVESMQPALGMSRLCSATFEQLFAFEATFFGSSNFKQLFPF